MQLRPLSFTPLSAAPSRAAAEPPSRLQQLAPPGAPLELLQPFFELGEKQSDEKLRGSLALVTEQLATDRGHLGKAADPAERAEILLTLFKAHPARRGEPMEARFPGAELSQLVKEKERFMDARTTGFLGEEMYAVDLTAPRRPASLSQLCKDYAGALDRIKSAPGRISRETEPDDVEWALDCVRIEHCHLHRDPARMALFRQLVGTFQNPSAAHVVMVQMESLPESRRATYLRELKSEMGDLGTFEDDWSRTVAEGKHIKALAKSVQMCVSVAREGDSHGELMSQLRELDGRDAEALVRGAHWRGPGQTWSQGLKNDPWTGLEASKDRELAQAVFSRAASGGEDHAQLLTTVKDMDWWKHGAQTSSLLAHSLKQDLPLAEALPRTLREFELTGQVTGLTSTREAVAQALAAGSIKGDQETLMKRFELIFTTRTAGGEAREKALSSSLAELLEVASPAKGGVVQTQQAVWVGGVRLRKAGS